MSDLYAALRPFLQRDGTYIIPSVAAVASIGLALAETSPRMDHEWVEGTDDDGFCGHVCGVHIADHAATEKGAPRE